MKTLLFAVGLCAALVACGDSPEKQNSVTNVTVPDYNPLPGGGGEGPMPCDVVYVIKIVTDAGTFTKEVPVYCNPAGDPYHGDPDPDRHYAVDPDPWDLQGTIIQIKELSQEQRTR